jgi:hypothetical protein
LRPDDHESDYEPETPPPPGKVVPFPSRRPDWLVDPGDEIECAPNPGTELPREVLEPRLPPPIPFRPPPTGRVAGPKEPASRTRAQGWSTPGSEWSGPFDDMTRVPTGPGGEATAGAEEHVGEAPAATPGPKAPAAWAPAASSVPVMRIPLPSGPPPAPASQAPPVRPVPLPVPVMPTASAAPDVPAAPPLHEPAWLVTLDAVRSSRPLQIGAVLAAACVIGLAGFLWPRGVGTIPLGRMRRDPARFDGATVVVRGRVGDDVFTVGNGWAFYLMQGRDTIVAFTRSRSPSPHEVVTLKGQVSTGFLDGMARQALFETDSTTK